MRRRVYDFIERWEFLRRFRTRFRFIHHIVCGSTIIAPRSTGIQQFDTARDVVCFWIVVIGDAKHSNGRRAVRLADPHLQDISVRVMVERRIIGPFSVFDADDLPKAIHLDIEPRHKRNLWQGENDAGFRRGLGGRHRSRRGQEGQGEDGEHEGKTTILHRRYYAKREELVPRHGGKHVAAGSAGDDDL